MNCPIYEKEVDDTHVHNMSEFDQAEVKIRK